MKVNKFNLPWTYEEEDINRETYVSPRLWGTKDDGEKTLICTFAVPVNPMVVKLILAAGKLVGIAQIRGFLK